MKISKLFFIGVFVLCFPGITFANVPAEIQGNNCIISKVKATEKLWKSYAKCGAKELKKPGSINACDTKAWSKFAGSWDKAEQKAVKKGEDCDTVSDTVMDDIVFQEIEDIYTQITQGLDESDKNAVKLASSLLKATEKRVSSLLKAYSKYIKKGDNAKLQSDMAKAQSKFTSTWDKAIAKGDKKDVAYTGPSANEIKTTTDTLVDDILEGLSDTTSNDQPTVLAGDITSDMTLTADRVWQLSGLVAVKGAVLTIEPGTTIIGQSGTGANTSYLVIDKDARIMADGTATQPIIFTSKIAHDGGVEAPGQWGGLTLIGNAANDQVKPYECNTAFVAGEGDWTDNSGILRHVHIINSGITMEQDKEINGLSCVGVGSGTIIDHVTVLRSDDDGIELWGGTVDVSNAYIEYCTDDYFDIDDGYSGTVTNLTINQHTDGNAGIEMSGTTAATFVGLTLTQYYSDKEGAIFFKKDGIGGHFENCQIIDNVDDGQTIVSQGDCDEFNISFEFVTITSPDSATNFVNLDATGTAADIKARFDAGVGNEEISDNDEPADIEILAGDIIDDMTLTADTVWQLSGLVVVTNGAVLTIEPGTTIIGESGTGTNTSYMIIDKDSRIMADGTATQPIIFTSKTAYDGGAEAPGQWGGLTIIGNAADVGVAPGDEQVGPYEVNTLFVPGTTDAADNSGVLRYVQILNSGITMEQDKEINGLSLVGVGSGTVVDHVTVKRSDDDGIEIWGGTVDVSNAYIEYCTDDYFDIDDGYSGTVTNLTINQHTDGNAGIEMSGTTAATFIGLELTQNYSDKEGAIFFKKDGIGGHFENCQIIDNVDDGQTIYSQGDADEANISFENVSITSPDTATNFVDADGGGSAADIKAAFDAGAGNVEIEL